MSFKSTSFSPRSPFSRAPEIIVCDCLKSLSFQISHPSWFIPFYAHTRILRFKRSENLSRFSRRYLSGSFISLSMMDLVTRVTRRYNLCMRIMSRTGMCTVFNTIFLHKSACIRDCTSGNIMLDPSNMNIYPESFHPVDMSRSMNLRRKAKGFADPTPYEIPSHRFRSFPSI